MKRFLFKGLVPFSLICLWLLVCIPVCRKESGMDYFMLWILTGLPFGIRRMLFFLIPKNYSLSGSIGVIGLDLMLAGILGGFWIILEVVHVMIMFRNVIDISRGRI